MTLSGTWIGMITMGDATPELVFEISQDNSGHLIGKLGIPSKGLQNLPLDEVFITSDYVVLGITAAQARFEGTFNQNEMVITGAWKEGPKEYPLILTPLKEEIDFDNYQNVNSSSLDFRFSGANFKYYSEEQDIQMLNELSKTLESNYLRITENLSTSMSSSIDVSIRI